MHLQSFIVCIETGEFMHVYNAIVVMKEILPVFPVASVHDSAGVQVDAVIEKFLKEEERADLKILGMSYQAGLKKREPLWALPTKPKVCTALPNVVHELICRLSLQHLCQQRGLLLLLSLPRSHELQLFPAHQALLSRSPMREEPARLQRPPCHPHRGLMSMGRHLRPQTRPALHKRSRLPWIGVYCVN